MIARITSRTYSNVGILKISLLHRRPPCGHKKNRKIIETISTCTLEIPKNNVTYIVTSDEFCFRS